LHKKQKMGDKARGGRNSILLIMPRGTGVSGLGVGKGKGGSTFEGGGFISQNTAKLF